MDRIVAEYDLELKKFKGDIKQVQSDLTKTESVGVNSAKKISNEFDKAGSKMQGATKKTSSSFSQMGASLASTMGAIGLTMGVAQVVQFGKASAEAFIDAEKNAQLLLFSLKGNEGAQRRLMDQAAELQNTTIFDDDTIQQAQTFLANQGRTEDQIKKVISAAVELSTVTGVDLNTAVMQLDATFEGNIGKMGKLDSGFKSLTKEQLANGAAADLLIEKYNGTAKAMGDTTAGKLAKLKNQFGELQESIGGKLVPVINGFVVALQSIGKGDIGGFLKNIFVGQVVMGIREMVLGTDKLNTELTDFEKNKIRIANATDAEIEAEIKLKQAQGLNTAEMEKYIKTVREGMIKQTFEELAQVLDITTQQYEKLVAISDKYGISARINSSLILDIKNTTEEGLNEAFEKFHKTLNVSKEDWDEYIGKVKGIKPLHDDLAKSTTKQLGPYDQLNAKIGELNKKMLDAITLGKDYTLIEMELIDLNKQKVRIDQEGASALTRLNEVTMTRINLLPLEAAGSNLNFEALQKENRAKLDGVLATVKLNDAENTGHKLKMQNLTDWQTANQVVSDLISTLKDKELKDAGDNEKKKKEIMKRYAVFEFLLKTSEIIANTAVAVTSMLKIPPPFGEILAGIVIATGAAQEGIAADALATVLALAEGTSSVPGGTPGKDSVPAMLMPKEAVIPAGQNMAEPGLAKAWIDGNLKDFIMAKYVTPALKEQEKQMQSSFANNIANSMLIQQSQIFDDVRMARLLSEGNNINKHGYKLIAESMKKNINPWAV
jgi:hypothetical protein